MLHQFGVSFDLYYDARKHKIKIRAAVNTVVKQRLRLNGQNIKRSSDFCYLGSIVVEDGGTSKEVNARIQKVRGSFSKLRSVWPSK